MQGRAAGDHGPEDIEREVAARVDCVGLSGMKIQGWEIAAGKLRQKW